MGLDKWMDAFGLGDEHFGVRERRGLFAENQGTKDESRQAIEKRARQALSKAALKGKGGKGGKGK